MKEGKTKRKWSSLVLAGTLVTLLLVAACGPVSQSTTSGSEMVVEVGDLAPITGPTAGPEQINLHALQDYVRFFNDKQGIPGVTVKLLWVDTALEIPRFASGYYKFVERGVPIIYSDDSLSMYSIRSQLRKDQMPIVSGTTTNNAIYPPDWVYCPTPTFGEVSTVVLDHFMQSWQEDRPARATYIGPNNYLCIGAAEEVKPYAESIGMEILPTEICPYVVIDATAELLRMKDNGTDLVMIQNIVPAAAPTLRDAERLGLLDQMQFAGLEYSMGETLMNMAGDATEGYMAPRTLPWFDETEIPGIRYIMEAQTAYRNQARMDPEYMSGWVGGAIVCEAVRRAIEEVGYDGLDSRAAKRALDSMKDFDVDGLTRISYSPDQRRGSRRAAVYQIVNGSIVRVSDWKETPLLVP